LGQKNNSMYVILGLLNHEDLTGYDIKKQVENNLSNFWNISYGQIYPELKKLLGLNYIECTINYSDNSPTKKIYSITKEGREVLQKWLKSSSNPENNKFEILLKLYFSADISKEFTIESINDFLKRHSEKIDLYEQFKQSLSKSLDIKDHKYRYMTLLFGLYMEEAFIKWGKEAKKMLEAIDD